MSRPRACWSPNWPDTLAGCLPGQHQELAVVGPDATALEIAAIMAHTGCPPAAVTSAGHRLMGAVTLDGLLDRVLGS